MRCGGWERNGGEIQRREGKGRGKRNEIQRRGKERREGKGYITEAHKEEDGDNWTSLLSPPGLASRRSASTPLPPPSPLRSAC